MDVAGLATVRIQGDLAPLAEALEEGRSLVGTFEDEASRGYGGAGDAAEQFGNDASGAAAKAASANDNLTNATERLGSSYRSVLDYAKQLAAIAGVGLTIGSFISNTSESEFAIRQLEAALQSTGGAIGLTVEELQHLATELQKVTTFGDEAVMSAQSILLTFTSIGGEILPRAITAIADFATRMRMDLSSAARMVGRALNDPTVGLTMLTRAGVSFSEEQQNIIRGMVETNRLADAQAFILGELEKRFEGSARAARNTLGGALQGLGNAFGDLFEVARSSSSSLQNSIEAVTRTISSGGFQRAMEVAGTAIFKVLELAAGAVSLLARNIEPLIVLFTALAARMAAPIIIGFATMVMSWVRTIGLAASAMLGFQGALNAAIVRAVVLSRVMAFFGGPIGLAITAVATGLAIWATRSREATDSLEEHQRIVEAIRAGYVVAEGAANRWADAVQGVTASQTVANASTQLRTYQESLVDLTAEIQHMNDVTRNAARENVFGGTLETQAIAVTQLRQSLESFKAQADIIATALANSTDPVEQQIAQTALAIQGLVDELMPMRQAVIEAFTAMVPFRDQLSEADKAALDLAIRLFDIDVAAVAAAGGLGTAGGAAGNAANQFYGAAAAADAYVAALNRIAGVQAVALTDRARVDTDLAEALRQAELAGREDFTGATTFELRAEAFRQHQLALTRIAADEADRRTQILIGIEQDAEVGQLEGVERAVRAREIAFQAELAQMMQLGATREELDAATVANAQIIANLRRDATSEGGGGGGGGDAANAFELARQRIQEQTVALRDQAAANELANEAATEFLITQELLRAAQESGIPITAALRREIAGLARDYMEADAAANGLTDTQDEFSDKVDEWGATFKDVMGTFVNALKEGATLSEAMGKVLDKLIDKLLDVGLGFLELAFKMALQAFLGRIGGGFAEGGVIRGPGSAMSDNLLVRASPGEFIVNAAATRQHFDLLRAINDNQVQRFASGGVVTPIRNKMGMGRNGMDVQVNIINETGAPVKAQRRGTAFDGRRAIVTLVLQAGAQGELDPMFSRIGAAPRAVRRGR